MEVLLLTDIAGIGKKNDLLVVKSGFALNHLLPFRKALVVTPNVRKRYAEQIRTRAIEKENEKQVLTSLSNALSGKVVHLSMKVAKTGKLFASVHPDDIAKALKEEHTVDIAADAITIKEHIKTVGMHTVEVAAGTQKVKLSVEVKAAEAEKKAKAA